MTVEVLLSTLRLKGYLAYEYNPFHNYQTDVDLYLIDDLFIVPENMAVNTKNGLLLTKKNGKWVDEFNNIITDGVKEYSSGMKYAEAGSVLDLDTDKLKFDLNHPVDIEVLPSYDGSVNLILNDDKNIPRLINSRFSAREKNTYEIVDRIGENDTNIYNSKTFDKDTSLYFLYEYNPTISYLGFVQGTLLVGSYCFYFTYCDSDDNESDYIAESGIIPVFIGNDGDPFSMDGGIKNLTTSKGIKLRLENLDKSYNYLKVYYVRYFADYLLNRVCECKKIYKKYPINSSIFYIQITGYETVEDLDPNILNITRFNPKSILAQAQCKNMLFFGNIVKNSDDYKELLDCSLRMIPSIVTEKVKMPDYEYLGSEGYYNSKTIYNKVGYFNNEYYRFGVVYIYQNGTLSNVYNTLGGEIGNGAVKQLEITQGELYSKVSDITLVRNYIKSDENGWIKNDDNTIISGININSKGVCKINIVDEEFENIYGIKFTIPDDVLTHLKEDLGIRGLFFVRLKCVPTIIALCYLLPMDEQLEAPVLKYKDDENKYVYKTECFVSLSESRVVTNDYESRLYEYQRVEKSDDSISKYAYAAICPDFLLNLPYYNQIFNGGSFRLKSITEDSDLKKSQRFYILNSSSKYSDKGLNLLVRICSVTEDVPTVALGDKIYRLEIGETEEAYRFRYAEIDNGTTDAGDSTEDVNKSYNIVRGKYSPYLAIYSETKLATGLIYNILQDTSINITLEYQNRMDSSEPFYAISDRYNFEGLSYITTESKDKKSLVCWRGDCFINQFTYRLNRNFNDPSLPNNDEIIDKNTWYENYTVDDPEQWANISRSDINAVLLGSWITIKLKSSINYALRSLDHSYVSEEALMGSPRSFYPRSKLLWRGENKIPDSYLYNDAYRATLGYKCYFVLLDINYIKDTFSNRILYSAVSIQDSFKNNYRYSLSTYFRDYSLEYGGIMKLVSFEGYLLVIFEHAIGVAVINERILAGTGDGEPVFINTQNVLPEELTIITDTYGTLWPDSVVKTESGTVYGVDTIAKKIWRIKGQQIELISDFKVNKFLIDNITLGERELYPIVGLKNVKTHYNNNKKDIMFTFYDDVYKDEEKVWNLCYNELLELFITFYSWLPSYSENIDTKFFTFNRESSKYLTLLGLCNYNNIENKGVLLDTPILCSERVVNDNYYTVLHYRDKEALGNITLLNSDGTTRLISVPIESKLKTIDTGIIVNTPIIQVGEVQNVTFVIEKDHWGFYKYFETLGEKLVCTNSSIFTKDHPIIVLEITPTLSGYEDAITGTVTQVKFKTETVALTTLSIVTNNAITPVQKSLPNITTDFYLHGLAGIFNVVEDTYPTHWYNEYHPFEFEVVINDKVGQLKIFENLVLISNKAEPESFHFEIEGDNYDFSMDKRTMYFRLEATKNLFLNLGSDIIYDRKYTDVIANNYTHELNYRGDPVRRNGKDIYSNDYTDSYTKLDKVYPVDSQGLVQLVKSTIFPLYYERVDTYNDIYHLYHLMHGHDSFDFKNLSGSEIVWNRDLNLFNIVTHIKNSPIDYVGRLRGNSRYKEAKWNIQIPSITFMLKNEDLWRKSYDDSNVFIVCEDEICGDKTLGGACDNSSPDSANVFEICEDELCGNKVLGCKNANEGQFILCKSLMCRNDGLLACDSTYNNKIGGTGFPPIVINSDLLPNDLDTTLVSPDKLPNIYSIFGYNHGIEVDGWTARKETKIRDKWVKIRIRYSGKNLAVIHSLITLYNVSYS